MFAPGHLGELTQIVDFALVDAVLEETGRREKRLRLLPSRVVVYFVLALALFEHHSYRTVWSKLTAALTPLALVCPAVSSLTRARRRVGAAPLRRLFETLAGPVARPGQAGSFYRGLRTVAVDGTLLHTPDDEMLTWREFLDAVHHSGAAARLRCSGPGGTTRVCTRRPLNAPQEPEHRQAGRRGSGPTTLPTATERTGQRRLPAKRIRDDNLLNVSPKDQAVLQLRGDEPRLGRVVAGDMSVGSRRTAGRRVS
ncbi:transposase domain-containing protein [Streptomyces sp. NPDC001890]|uniref:transposase domain-containing protein n=1 Tax=Streptomyces sp. NPDC001890 TaxID=3364620 RepID=UPI0036745A5F